MSGPFGSSQWMYQSARDFYDFPIEQSLKFNDDDSSYLSWTPASAGNRKTWTWSGWVKRGRLSAPDQGLFEGNLNFDGSNYFSGIRFQENGELIAQDIASGSYNLVWKTSAVYRDTSAWYHIVVSYDTTQASSSNAVGIYVNGVQQNITFTAYVGSYSQNRDSYVNATNPHGIGTIDAANYFDGYMSEINFIDGQALDASSFGEFKSGVWIPKDPSGLTYGTNGFRLSFQNDTVSEGFNTVTYTGNGGTQSINGLGFAPDLVWIKNRDSGSYYHALLDSVRGTDKRLFSNTTDAENTTANTLTSFDADGFTLGSQNGQNLSGNKHVAWCWDAGSGSPVSNTDGSITSTVKANAAYGMSIISYTGTGSVGTIGHGLNSAPEMIIARSRNTVASFITYHEATGNTKYLELNTTLAATTNSSHWNNTSPTSSVFTVGTNSNHNNSGSPCIAYAFHSVTGYSKVGSYSGNGSTTGPVVNLGFKPAFVMIKNVSNSNWWYMGDNTRDTVSPILKELYANVSDAEYTDSSGIAFTSTGFQPLRNSGYANANGDTYIYIAFADTRDNAFWRDQSGNGNDWQPNNLTYQDSLPDSTTNNFAVLNPLDDQGATLQEGNLELSGGNNIRASFACPTSGKWYFEGLKTNATASPNFGHFGLFSSDIAISSALNESMLYRSDGGYYENDTLITTWASYTTGDVIGIAVDVDGGQVSFYKNNTLQGTRTLVSQISSSQASPAARNNTGQTSVFNFGQDSSFAGNKPAQGNTDDNGVGDFFYAPPSGHLALAASNLPNPTIDPAQDDVPSDYFNTVLWTGNDTERSITGVGFQPDLVWTKYRSAVGAHTLMDSIRGASARLFSNLTDAEAASNGLISFDADGFTMGDNATSHNINANGETVVGWSWLAGNGTSSNTDGSITSTVSVNEKAGFSILTYSGDGTTSSVGHGLSQTPELFIIKRRDAALNWYTYTTVVDGSMDVLFLNLTDAKVNSSLSAPTSSVLNIAGNLNLSGADYVSYVFHSVESFSRFGSYVGNGSTDGPFVYTGFRPAFVIVKRTSGVDPWYITDSKTSSYNVTDRLLLANSSGAELSGRTDFDFLSNGFKNRASFTGSNASGNTYIYMAFAENPFKYANAR